MTFSETILTAGTILVVEDQPEELYLLSQILKENGYMVRSVSSGSLALLVARTEALDVILLDISVPDMSGYDVCKHLKADARTRDIPVIFISALDNVSDKVRAFQAGGVDYITRPFRPDEVQARVATHLAIRQMQQHMHKQNSQLDAQNRQLRQKTTPYERAEAVPPQNKDSYEHTTSIGRVGFWDWHLETNEMYLAPTLKALLGYEDHEIKNTLENWIVYVHPDDVELLLATNEAYLNDRVATYEVEYRVRHKDQSIRWINTRGQVTLRDEHGKPLRLLGIHTDITHRKQAAKQLHHSQHMLTATFASIRDAVFIIDADTVRIVDCNPAASAIFGYPREEMLGQSASLRGEDAQTVEEFQKDLFYCVQQRRPDGLTVHEMKRKDGTSMYTEHSIVPLNDEENQHIGWVDVVRDITERKRMEEALQKAHYDLEQRVQERTADLYLLNQTLQREIEERSQQKLHREAILTVAMALRTASSRTEMVTILLEQVGGILQADGAILLTRNRETGGVIVEQGYGIWEHLTGIQVVDEAEKKPQPPIVTDTELGKLAQRDAAVAQSYLMGSVKSLACIPLIAHDQSIGTLGVGCQHVITRENMQLLSAIGDMIANALRRVTLHEQTERRLQHLQALHSIDQAITTSLNLQYTLDVVLKQVVDQLDIDAALVMLAVDEQQKLIYAAGRGFDQDAVQQRQLCIGQGCAGQIASVGHPLYLEQLQQHCDVANCACEHLCHQEGFVSYYGLPLIARGQVKGVLELFHRTPIHRDQEWYDFMGTLAGQASIAIDNADMVARLQQANAELMQAYDATIEGWARALELRDKETEGHCRRVTELTVQLARIMNFSEQELVHVRRGAILHDIGKMAIPDHILLKAGPLTDEEYAIMKQHPVYARNLLSSISFLRPALHIPSCHHERWDGAGYPYGLKRTDIPLAARVFAVVDVWDALCFDRPYRKAWAREHVYTHIRDLAGTHFDPEVVTAFLRMIDQAGG